MRALIFSVSAGGGHSNAADAMKEYIELQEPESKVEIIDTLKYINPVIDKVVIGSYLQTVKNVPYLFGKIYDYTETDTSILSVTSKLNEYLSNKILPHIEEFNPDVVISTHPFSTEMLGILKTKTKIAIPFVSIMTDYAPHNAWLHEGVDAYVVSNCDMVSEMENRGIDKQIIYPFGIPIKSNFFKKFNKEDTLRELGLSTDKITLLIMGGSLGIGKIKEIYEELSGIDQDFQVIVIAGTNKKLYADIESLKLTSNKPTGIIGYTKNVNKYMQASHLLLTKPGGLSITEALVSNLPIAIFCPIPGQEEKNAEFLLRHNLAVDLKNGKKCSAIISNLVSSKTELDTIKKQCKSFAKPEASKDVYELIKKLIKKQH